MSRIPQRRPLQKPIGMAAVIFEKVDARNYVLHIDSRQSQHSWGFYMGPMELEEGDHVIATWREESHGYEILPQGKPCHFEVGDMKFADSDVFGPLRAPDSGLDWHTDKKFFVGVESEIAYIFELDEQSGEITEIDTQLTAAGSFFTNAYAFSPDGDYLAVGGDLALEIWNFDKVTGLIGSQLAAPASGPVNTVFSIAWSPDSAYIAVSMQMSNPGDHEPVDIWNFSAGFGSKLSPPSSARHNDAFLEDGLRVLWNPAGTAIILASGPTSPYPTFPTTWDGQMGTAWLWSAGWGARLPEQTLRNEWFNGAAFTAAGDMVAFSERAHRAGFDPGDNPHPEQDRGVGAEDRFDDTRLVHIYRFDTTNGFGDEIAIAPDCGPNGGVSLGDPTWFNNDRALTFSYLFSNPKFVGERARFAEVGVVNIDPVAFRFVGCCGVPVHGGDLNFSRPEFWPKDGDKDARDIFDSFSSQDGGLISANERWLVTDGALMSWRIHYSEQTSQTPTEQLALADLTGPSGDLGDIPLETSSDVRVV